MTDDQLQYIANARMSREMVKRRERLAEEADYHEKMLNSHSLAIVVFEMSELREKLDKLWDEQVDLYFKIQAYHKKYKTKVFMESIRPNYRNRATIQRG